MPSALNSATQADQEAGTTSDAFTSPLRQQSHPSASKAWARSSDTALLQSYNMTSFTDIGVGNYTLTVATNFSGDQWGAVATAASDGIFVGAEGFSVTAVSLKCRDHANNLADTGTTLNTVGDQ